MRRGAMMAAMLVLIAADRPPAERPAAERPPAERPAAERIVPVDAVVGVRIGDAAGRMRIDPGATAMPLIAADWAERAGMKAGMFGIRYGVGPRQVHGATAVARIDYGDGPRKQRIGFASVRYAADVDGVVGPGGLPEPIVRFVLRPESPGERTVRFAMVDQGGLAGGWSDRFAMIQVGGQPMRLRFDPHHARTLATAGAGVRLAAAFGGRLEGEPTMTEIAFGIERPVRRMVLARPLEIGMLSIPVLGVRTGDHGSATGIADADVPVDPDEIVVVARGKRDWNRDRLALGADVLGRCSTIVFDRPAGEIRLTCA